MWACDEAQAVPSEVREALSRSSRVGNPGVIWRSLRGHPCSAGHQCPRGARQGLPEGHFLDPVLCFCHENDLEQKPDPCPTIQLPLSADTAGLGEEAGDRLLLCFSISQSRRRSDEVNAVCFSLDRDPSSRPDPPLTIAKQLSPRKGEKTNE